MKLVVEILLFLATVASGISVERTFRYQNPISDGLDPHGVRDCQVFRDGNDLTYGEEVPVAHAAGDQTAMKLLASP